MHIIPKATTIIRIISKHFYDIESKYIDAQYKKKKKTKKKKKKKNS